jgi:SAM-dependent methyltransferase
MVLSMHWRLRRILWRYRTRIGMPDYISEIDWWDHYLEKRPVTIFDPEHRRKAFPTQLLPFIRRIQENKKKKVRLLEIGSGPVSLLAWGVDQGLFDLVAVDPLAEDYKQLMVKHNLRYPVVPIEGYGEKLLDIFTENSFDVVYSSNSIDHSISPQKCMRNISLVIKNGGIVCLEGYIHEGSNEGWIGLHQHDLIPDDGQILHANKDGICTNLTMDLKLKCIYQSIAPFSERSINSFGYEWDENGIISKWYYDKWYTMLFEKV